MTQEEVGLEEASVARIVHFVIWDGFREVCRPAIVVNDWPGSGRTGYVNIQVFTDYSNDGAWGKSGQVWETSVLPNQAVRAIRTWHWPRLCKKLQNPAPPYKPSPQEKAVHHAHQAGMLDVHNCYACRLEQEQVPAGE